MKLAYRALVGLLALLFVCIAAEVRAADATWPKSITLGTASPGGPYYVYGQGVATILSHALGIEVTAQATQGPSQNVALLEKGEAMLGFTTMGVALQGWNGTGWTKGTQYRAMRAIFPMFDTPFQFVVPKKSAIRSVAELAGKRLGDGPRAGTGGIYFPEVFKALGIQVALQNSSWEDALSKVVSGEFDGMAVAAGVPLPALAETDAKEPMVFIAPSSAQIATLREHLPELSLSTIPAGSYSSMTEDYHTVGLFNFAIAHKDLPDDLVYRVVKSVYENHDQLVKAHPAAKETIAANVGRDSFLPFHPGAVRYYREIGISIPDALIAKE